MLDKKLINEVIKVGLSTGADFAEVFIERKKYSAISMLDSHVSNIADSLICGLGLRLYKGVESVYSSTSDLSRASIIRTAEQTARMIRTKNLELTNSKALHERINFNINKIKTVPSSSSNKEKVEILKTAYFAAKNYDPVISQVSGTFLDEDRTIWIANSNGLYTSDRQIRCRLMIESIASKNGENQTGGARPGARKGLELFTEEIDPVEVGKEASRIAKVNVNSNYIKAGVMPVAIENGFGGVIFHESCGHSLEATSVAIGASQMAGKLGQKIANSKVTAIDDGTIPNGWGSYNIDDEGRPAQKNILIENGILKSYMVDTLNARKMKCKPTGNARRENFYYEPTSRMTNTYIAPGNDEDKDIISSIEDGLYCARMGGGSVNPVTGAFNFAVLEGYKIHNGEIKESVRGASLIGTGSQIIQDIDMVGKDMKFGQGMCGSSSGMVPANVGQPLVRVSKITVGGR